MNERECTIALNTVESMDPARFTRLIRRFGSAKGVLGASEDALCAVEGIGPVTAGKIVELRDGRKLREELCEAARLRIDVVTASDPGYPEPLMNIHDPPPVLYIKGRILPADALSLAIVGSRHPTRYGRAATWLVAGGAAGAGFTVISGMARGIDSEAHRAALESGGRTIAVLGSGLDVVYPPENAKLAHEIAGNGAVASERSLGTRPFGQNFPARNRIISGLALGVVVVEATERSGALITADLALSQGREVFSVPGDIRSPLSRGTHMLIRQGATLVEGMNDIASALGIEIARVCSRGQGGAGALLSAHERRVLASMGFQAASADDIVNETGLEARDVAVALVSLELRGLVQRALDGYVRRSKGGG